MGTTRFRRCLQGAGTGFALLISLFPVCLDSPALAANVGSTGFARNYEASPGEVNNITVSLSAAGDEYVISDVITIADVDDVSIPVSGCYVIGGEARCPVSGDTLFIRAGDEADRVTIVGDVDVTVCGGPGDDVLLSGTADDSLEGGSGNDTVSGGGGDDSIRGGAVIGDPQCSQDEPPAPLPGRNTLLGGDGRDSLEGGDESDGLDGGAGNDDLYGFGGDDSLVGGEGNDLLLGYSGTDALAGGTGNDELGGGSDDDLLDGGEGDDALGLTFQVDGVVTSDEGNDLMYGGAGNDTLNGGPGATLAVVGGLNLLPPPLPRSSAQNGRDSLIGGDGTDTATYVNRTSPVDLSFDGRPNDGGAGEQDMIGADVEKIVGGSGDDTISGSSGDDTLDGGEGADLVLGGPGDDTLAGGTPDAGRDELRGGPGQDSLNGNAGDDSLDGEDGDDGLSGGGGNDSLQGGTGDDSITGGAGLDALFGGVGNDTLDGSEPNLVGADGADDLHGDHGNDSLHGGPGDDNLDGGLGMDLLSGGEGTDAADYRNSDTAVNVTPDGKRDDGRAREKDNVAPDVEGVVGSSADDFVTGGSGASALRGSAGEDFLDGGRGADRLDGGDGADVVRSRDNATDLVSCGGDFDLAIADASDIVRDDCELVDLVGGRPRAGRFVALSPLRGSVEFRPRAMQRLVPLLDRVRVPTGSSVDAREGAVEVTWARGRKARARRATVVTGGAFSIQQHGARRPLTEIRLAGGRFSPCRQTPAQGTTRISETHRVRALTVRGRGTLRSVGRRSAATGRGAVWETVDRCDGTLTRVRSGTVTVLDLERRRRVRLQKGESHLAPAR